MRWICNCGNRRSLKNSEECPECGRVNSGEIAISRKGLEDLPFTMEVPEDSKICGQCTQLTREEICPNCGHLIINGETLPYDPRRVQIIVVANG